MYKCLIGLTHCLHLPDLLSDRQERDFDSSAISWAHNIAGVVNPCNSELVSFVKEGALRVVGRFVNKKGCFEGRWSLCKQKRTYYTRNVKTNCFSLW
jgi:hypothetical protein